MVEFEVMQITGIKGLRKILGKGDDWHTLSGNFEQYREGYVVSGINANDEILMFTNGLVLCARKALGDVNESLLRRIQIREAFRRFQSGGERRDRRRGGRCGCLRSDPERQGTPAFP